MNPPVYHSYLKNSHNVMWGYTKNNGDGETVKDWTERNNMNFIYSGRWYEGYNPDNIFVSHNIKI